MKGSKVYVFAAALISAASCAVCAYSKDVEEDLRSEIVRLHIIAESDSEYDQAVKLEVRDAVLDKVRTDMPDDEAELAELAEDTANEVLSENGCAYGAKAEYGTFMFPEKPYKGLTLPAGEYEGVRVVLGSGAGANWWCVMYPPLCVEDGEPELSEEGEAELQSRLREDTYGVIAEPDGVQVKFRLAEAVRKVVGAINGE